MTKKKNMNKLNVPIMLLVLSCSVIISKYTNSTNNHKAWECSNIIVEQVSDSTNEVVLALK